MRRELRARGHNERAAHFITSLPQTGSCPVMNPPRLAQGISQPSHHHPPLGMPTSNGRVAPGRRELARSWSRSTSPSVPCLRLSLHPVLATKVPYSALGWRASLALPAAPEPVAAVRRRSRQPACHARAPCPRIAGAKLCPCAPLERAEPLLPSGFGSEERSPPSFPGAGSPGTLSGSTVRTSSPPALGYLW